MTTTRPSATTLRRLAGAALGAVCAVTVLSACGGDSGGYRPGSYSGSGYSSEYSPGQYTHGGSSYGDHAAGRYGGASDGYYVSPGDSALDAGRARRKASERSSALRSTLSHSRSMGYSNGYQ